MNIGELKAAIKDIPDDMEMVGDFSGSQQDVWKLCFGKIDDVGLYHPIEGTSLPVYYVKKEINFMICIG